jgi:hypothetical protein
MALTHKKSYYGTKYITRKKKEIRDPIYFTTNIYFYLVISVLIFLYLD